MSRTPRRPSFWPTATQEALLQVALAPAGAAGARWKALRPVDLATLPPGSFALMPLLYERLSEEAPEEPQLARLLGTYRRTWYRNQLLLRRLELLLPALRENDVDVVVAGGTSALLRWYPKPGSRPVPELELLVQPDAAPTAVATAMDLGWTKLRSGPEARLTDEAQFSLVVVPGGPPALGPLSRGGTYLALRERAVELQEAAGAPIVLDPTDELLLVCAAGARTVRPPSCQWLVDAAQLTRSGQLPPPENVIARAQQLRLLEPLRETLNCLASVLGPSAVRELLAGVHAQPSARRDRIAFRLGAVGSTRLVAPAQLLSTYLHATADESPLRTASHFPRHLRETWGTPTWRATSRLAARKLAAVARPRRAQAPPVGRSRSASS